MIRIMRHLEKLAPALAAALCASALAAAPAARTAQKKPQKGQAMAEQSARVLSPEFRGAATTKTTAATFAPVRTAPVQRGEFKVDLVIIAFPDCEQPESAEAVRAALDKVSGSHTIADYYREYSQGVTWPVLEAHPDIYLAPHPLGYYCRRDSGSNLIGYADDGDARAGKLREDALKFVASKRRLRKKGAYTCFVYCMELTRSADVLERVVRPLYPPKPSPEQMGAGARDKLEQYKPAVCWADPLWPNSLPQVSYPANGRTLVHELGHCLGAPDFYHATEEHDGVEGTPCLPWDYGPTGPGYCRFIHHAFVPATAYPKVSKSGEYTLAPRSTTLAASADGAHPLGLLVPSAHPNYVICIEYCHGEKPPVGHEGAEGLLVQAINVTMASPMLGPPDLCYAYRRGDPDHKGVDGDDPYLRDGDRFDAASDPAAVLPNLMPAGVSISDIRTDRAVGTCTFRLDVEPTKATKQELDAALLPRTEILRINLAMPTSFHVEMNVKYRGEPLLTEYGICYGTRKDPTEKTGTLFPLHHRDRYDARIIGLKPGETYYVRSYARSPRGISYGDNQKKATLPVDRPGSGSPTLFSPSDNLLSNWYYQKWYFGHNTDNVINSANPLFAFMALANYYRTVPGRPPQGSGSAPRMTLVHCNPADSRPKFRLVETEKLKVAMERLVKEAGFRQADFDEPESDDDARGKRKKKPAARPSAQQAKRGRGSTAADYGENAQWVAKCADALGIKNPETAFFTAKTEEDVLRRKDMIRKWLLDSRPVMLVRENKTLSDEISERWPLDIAFIDGLGEDDETFHFVFPGGRDSGLNGARTERYARPSDVLNRTSDAMLIFYRP